MKRPFRRTISAARSLAEELDQLDCDMPENGKSCINRERFRSSPVQEGAVRGFGDYDPMRLCFSCRAYWFAEMAAITLERSERLRTKFPETAERGGP